MVDRITLPAKRSLSSRIGVEELPETAHVQVVQFTRQPLITRSVAVATTGIAIDISGSMVGSLSRLPDGGVFSSLSC